MSDLIDIFPPVQDKSLRRMVAGRWKDAEASRILEVKDWTGVAQSCIEDVGNEFGGYLLAWMDADQLLRWVPGWMEHVDLWDFPGGSVIAGITLVLDPRHAFDGDISEAGVSIFEEFVSRLDVRQTE